MRGRRLFGCLVKAPLGCAAYVLGASIVSAFLMPAACGASVGRSIAEGFDIHHRGRLEIGAAHMPAWLEPQSLENVQLFDPDGRRILAGSVRLPSLLRMGGAEVGGQLTRGEVVFQTVDVVENEDGYTNLWHALMPRANVGSKSPLKIGTRGGHLEFGVGSGSSPVRISGLRALAFGVRIERMSWRREIAEAWSPALVLCDVRGAPSLTATGGAVRLAAKFDGRIESPAGNVGGSAELYLAIDDLGALLAGDAAVTRRVQWRLRGVGGKAVDALLGTGSFFGDGFAGEQLELVMESERKSGLHRVGIKIRAAVASFEVRGRLEEGATLVADAGDELTLSFGLQGPWGERILAGGLFPFLGEVVPDLADGRAVLRSRAFRVPRDFDPTHLGGRFELELAAAHWRFPATWRALVRDGPLRHAHALTGSTVAVDVSGGRATLAEATKLGAGARAPLVSGGFALTPTGPADFAFDLEWEPDERGYRASKALRIGGDRRTPLLDE